MIRDNSEIFWLGSEEKTLGLGRSRACAFSAVEKEGGGGGGPPIIGNGRTVKVAGGMRQNFYLLVPGLGRQTLAVARRE